MCLSTVYQLIDGEESKIGESITSVVTEEDKLTFTDIMGDKTVVKGKIKSVDLVKNTILIEDIA